MERVSLALLREILLGAATSCETPTARERATVSPDGTSAEENAMDPQNCWIPSRVSFQSTFRSTEKRLYLVFIWGVGRQGGRNDVDPGSYHRREGDSNRWGPFQIDQNWVFTAENTRDIQREPTSAAPLLPRETGKANLSVSLRLVADSFWHFDRAKCWWRSEWVRGLLSCVERFRIHTSFLFW